MANKSESIPQENHKRKVLDMVAEGKISAQEAAQLLEAMQTKPKSQMKGRKLVFQIIQEGKEKPKVNLAIPVKLAKLGMNFIPQNGKLDAHIGSSNVDLSSINWKEIIDLAVSGETGELFYMEVEDDNGKNIIIKILVE